MMDLEIIKVIEKKIGKRFIKLEKLNYHTPRPHYVYKDQKVTGLIIRDQKEVEGLLKYILNLKALKILNLRCNELSFLPKSIENLKNLTHLKLRCNQLSSLPESIGSLENLIHLDLLDNKLRGLPESIGNLENLTYLNLAHNQLRSLPESIGNLRNLTSLNLARTRLSSLPESIGNLKKLTYLNFGDNQLSSLPESIGNLESLIHLDIVCNELRELPESIGNLKNLISLNLLGNKLSSLPKSIGNLRNLTELNLLGNKLNCLPESIGKLKKIKKFILEDNKIKKLPLTVSNLDLSYSLVPFDSIGLCLANNPIESPPIEILRQGSRAINNYFALLIDEVKLYEAKLIIVGEGSVGKTCLMKRLLNPTKKINIKELSTKGIDVQKWIVANRHTDNFVANIWDFGGQEIYHATHQFFLTRRSLYLFIWNARKDEDIIAFDYWLNVITLLGNKAPVIIVQNKCDERVKAIDEQSLKKKFPNIVGFHRVSALKGTNIETLIQSIKYRLEILPHVGTTLPAVFVKIKKALLAAAEKRKFIPYDNYIKFCKNQGLTREQADDMSQYYHDLGVFLHFQDNEILKNIVFLRPEWATQAVYKVLDTQEILVNRGRFKYEELLTIWKNYPEDYFPHLIELMKKFELCFKLDDSPYYIVPELLPGGQPQKLEWKNEKNVIFYYKYDFMPAGIITQFIVRNHKLIKNNTYWKSGTILTWQETEALVISNKYEREIIVRIRGKHPQDMLAIIRNDINCIHERLNKPSVQEQVPCSCTICSASEEPKLYEFGDLKEALFKKEPTIQCHKSMEHIRLEQLVGGIVHLHKVFDEFNLRIKGGSAGNASIHHHYYGDQYKFQTQIDTHNSCQTLGEAENPTWEIKAFLQDVEAKLATIKELSVENREKLEDCIDQAQNMMNARKPNKQFLRKTFETIGTILTSITTGVGAGVVANQITPRLPDIIDLISKLAGK